MAKSRSKYYLSMGDTVFDLSSIPEFSSLQLDSFLGVNLFTSLFKDDFELINALIELGHLIQYNGEEFAILKRNGTKREGYSYAFVSNDILYRNGFDYLSLESVQDFLIANRNKYKIINELVESFIEDLKRVRIIFAAKMRRIENRDGSLIDDELKKELVAKKKTYESIGYELKILEEIKLCLSQFMSDNYTFDRNLGLRYMSLLDAFAKKEILYEGPGGKKLNIKGLTRFVSKMALLLVKYPELEEPKKVRSVYSKDRLDILNNLKLAIESKEEISTISKGKSDMSVFRGDTIDAIDPDKYIFLEREDFERINGDSKKIQESIKTGIENLEEQKAKRGM